MFAMYAENTVPSKSLLLHYQNRYVDKYILIRQARNMKVINYFFRMGEAQLFVLFCFVLQNSYLKGLRLIASYNLWWQKDLQFLIIAHSVVINTVRYYLEDCALSDELVPGRMSGEFPSSKCKVTVHSHVLWCCFGQLF